MAFWLERILVGNRAICCVWGFVIARHNIGLCSIDQEHSALSGFTPFFFSLFNLNNKYNIRLASLLDELCNVDNIFLSQSVLLLWCKNHNKCLFIVPANIKEKEKCNNLLYSDENLRWPLVLFQVESGELVATTQNYSTQIKNVNDYHRVEELLGHKHQANGQPLGSIGPSVSVCQVTVVCFFPQVASR